MGKVGKKVVIVGAGGHGQVILDILIEAGIEAVGFLDTDKNKAKKNINGLKVFSSWQQLRIRHKAVVAVLGITRLGRGYSGRRKGLDWKLFP